MQEYRLYSRLDRTLVLECWGASTKHPDVTFEYSPKEAAQEMCFQARWTQDYKWILGCAGRMLWVGSAVQIVQMAQAFYEGCMKADHPGEEVHSFYDWNEWME